MSISRFLRFRRSLAGQLLILSLVFLLVLLGYFSVLPIIQFSGTDPVDRTRFYASFSISLALQDDGGHALSELDKSEEIVEISQANPNFRYYIKRGDEEVQFGDPPRWVESIKFTAPTLPERPFRKVTEGGGERRVLNCSEASFWQTSFDESGVPAEVSYRECDGERTYVEIAGIDTSISQFSGFFGLGNLRWFWSESKKILSVSIGFILISFLVVLFASRSFRNVAAVANSIDEQQIPFVLPEKGLPTEVLPLVRAINQMNRKLAESQEQQKFFLATAAHEMRTPMAILRTRLEELPDSQTKAELREDIRRITSLVEQLLRLMSIRNMGDLTARVDLVGLVRSVLADRTPMAMEKGIEIELRADIETHVINGDEPLINVALGNLIDNAISFSDIGDSLIVTINHDGHITVNDEGPGIVTADIGSIFEPFTKNPPNRKGHGLGLAIVKAIMSLHDGSVTARNAEDGGAQFVLQF